MMSRGLGKVEQKILRYFEMVNNDCADYINECDRPCPSQKGESDRKVETDTLCRYVAGIYKCPADSEYIHGGDYPASIYQSVLRAARSLEHKGYIERVKYVEMLASGKGGFRWCVSWKKR